MAVELLERLGIAIASAAIALLLACIATVPTAESAADVVQRTDATQITVQAAPGSDVDVGTGPVPSRPAEPP